MKRKTLIPTVLLCCIAQVNATMMRYNTSNQMIGVDNQSMSYNPEGSLNSVDSVNIINGKSGSIIEQQGKMVSIVFGGVRLLSNGVAQTIFTDHKSTLKTVSTNNNQRSYTDPYGSPIKKYQKDSYPLEHNRITFDRGYKINQFLINFNARNYMTNLKRFSSMDSYNVYNRYNFSNSNPIINFDPSGHSTKSILDFVGNMTIGVKIGSLLYGDNTNDDSKEAALGVALTIGGAFGVMIFVGIVDLALTHLMGEAYVGLNDLEAKELSNKMFGRSDKASDTQFHEYRTLLTDDLYSPAHKKKKNEILSLVNSNYYKRYAHVYNSHINQYVRSLTAERLEIPLGDLNVNMFNHLMNTQHEVINEWGKLDSFIKSLRCSEENSAFFENLTHGGFVENVSPTGIISQEEFLQGDYMIGHYTISTNGENGVFHGFFEREFKYFAGREKIGINDSKLLCPLCRAPLTKNNIVKRLYDA